MRNENDEWESYAIEINLRKGGTTHPFLTLQFLTDGTYDPETATFTAPSGKQKCFVASDHVESPMYRGLTPDDLFDIVVRHGLHFDQSRQTGVVFHMMTALTEAGHFGMTAVGDSPKRHKRSTTAPLPCSTKKHARRWPSVHSRSTEPTVCELLGVSVVPAARLGVYFKEFRPRAEGNEEGWGIAWWEDGHPHIVKEPIRADESELAANLAHDPPISDVFIVHVRAATIGHASVENTHPFKARRSDASGGSRTTAR